MIEAPAAIAVALLLDRLLGEPPDRVHPTVLMGKTAKLLMNRLPHTPAGGIALAVLTVLPFSAAAYAAVLLTPGVAKLLTAGGLLMASISWRGLRDYTYRVSRPLGEGDLETARRELKYLVSRNPERLERREICSACVESVAENSVDAVASPLLYFAIFSAAGLEPAAAAAVAYRCINTLDAMVGYPGFGSFGAPSARLDDLLNFLPSRLMVPFLLLSLKINRLSVKSAVHALCRFRRATKSPNAGIPMSIMAGGLGVRLIKPGHYTLGNSPQLPLPRDIERALKVVDVALLLYSGTILFFLAVV